MISENNLEGAKRRHQNFLRTPRDRAWRAAVGSVVGLLLLFGAAVVAAPSPSFAVDIGVSIRVGPPPLPVYDQPLCPGSGYIWTPGYWAYDPVEGYYWVPGTWVMAPEPGLLWTPGYWGWSGGFFLWHAGYWGPHVGFYGGVNYGFGYTGVGYEGGYWKGRDFYYNRAVNNVNVTHITNVYNRTVVKNVNVTRVSYNGGPGGLNVRPTSAQTSAEHERHVAPTSVQKQHQNLARQDRSQFASVNHGKPAVMASPRPSEFRAGNTPRPASSQAMTQHHPVHTAPSNARVEHSNSAGGAAHPSRSATLPQNRNSERPQASGNARPSHSSRSATPLQNRNSERPQASGNARPSNPSRAATPPQNRNVERAQGRTPNVEPRQTRTQPSQAAPTRKPENAPRPQVHEERKANPPAERKPERREPEPHR